MKQADIGMVGLGVMGRSLALNMAEKGFAVAVYNYTPDLTDAFLAGPAKGNKRIVGCYDLPGFLACLAKPRKVFLMIQAGQPVDDMLEKLLPLLDDGDIVIDGGNSHYADTARRVSRTEAAGKLFVGAGVSGGEAGALKGPSIMPGGSTAAWPAVRPILQAIAAKADDGAPCCSWVGEGGAGHFVKMVHNGIEYGDMQLISEAYGLMRNYLQMTAGEMHDVFRQWNETELDSYLIGITADILGKKDADGSPLVENILDAAGQKGTGKWTGIAALDEGVPLPLITEAVFARCLSGEKDERVAAADVFHREVPAFSGDRAAFLASLQQALYAAKVISYAQGYSLLCAADSSYGWNLDLSGIALLWRGGCIIRSAFLRRIAEAYAENPRLPNLLLAPYFVETLRSHLPALRAVCAAALTAGVPAPAMTSAVSYFDGYTTANLPANLLQAQRDYFGAHTYERTDAPRGQRFHTDWAGDEPAR